MNGLFKVKHRIYRGIHTVYGSIDEGGDIYLLMYIRDEWCFQRAKDYEPVEDEESD